MTAPLKSTRSPGALSDERQPPCFESSDVLPVRARAPHCSRPFGCLASRRLRGRPALAGNPGIGQLLRQHDEPVPIPLLNCQSGGFARRPNHRSRRICLRCPGYSCRSPSWPTKNRLRDFPLINQPTGSTVSRRLARAKPVEVVAERLVANKAHASEPTVRFLEIRRRDEMTLDGRIKPVPFAGHSQVVQEATSQSGKRTSGIVLREADENGTERCTRFAHDSIIAPATGGIGYHGGVVRSPTWRPYNQFMPSHSTPIIPKPTYIRLPRSGEHCPWSGLARSFMIELCIPGKANNRHPPVESISRVRPGCRRGVRLVVWGSLERHIRSFPATAELPHKRNTRNAA